MKHLFKLVSVLVLLTISITSLAKDPIKRDLTVYGTYQLSSNGFGVDVSYNNFYTSYSHGRFILPNGGYIKNENKYTIGGLYKGFSLGVTYHTYGDIYETIELTNYATCKVSVELGVEIEVKKPVHVNMRVDVIQRQVVLGLGWNFNLNRYFYYRPRLK